MNRLRTLALLLAFVVLFLWTNRWLGMLLSAVLVGWLLLGAVERRPLGQLGFALQRRTPKEIGIGFAMPCAALLLVLAPLIALGALRYESDDGTVAGWLLGHAQLLLILGIPAAAEEALFRGYPFQKLVELIGPTAATLAASALFAVAHGSNPAIGVFALINIFLAGVMLSVAYLRTGSLWFASAVHLGWNWQIAGPMDLPVSGLEVFDTPLYEPRSWAADWLTGGAFGPEGGLAGLLALVLVSAGVWQFTGKRMDA